MAIDPSSLGADLQKNLEDLVQIAKDIDPTTNQNVLGAVLDLNKQTSSTEAVNSAAMKTFNQYTQLPVQASRQS